MCLMYETRPACVVWLCWSVWETKPVIMSAGISMTWESNQSLFQHFCEFILMTVKISKKRYTDLPLLFMTSVCNVQKCTDKCLFLYTYLK